LGVKERPRLEGAFFSFMGSAQKLNHLSLLSIILFSLGGRNLFAAATGFPLEVRREKKVAPSISSSSPFLNYSCSISESFIEKR
jgi:hypothetical protein